MTPTRSFFTGTPDAWRDPAGTAARRRTNIAAAMTFRFELLARDGRARRGRLTTAHGSVETPVFMPVGTQGAVKALTSRDLTEAGVGIILGNTYHLHLRPGEALIARRGGLHRFIGWDRAILT